MTWFILTGLFAIVGGAALLYAIFWKAPAPTGTPGIAPEPSYARVTAIGVAAVALLLWLITTSVMSATQVSAGHVGVEYQFGRITGTIPPGFHLIAPWASVTDANTQVQAHTFAALTAFSKETQNVDVTATLNYSVNPGDVRSLYTDVGPDWFNKLVETRVNQFFKDETVRFRAVEIAPNRDRIRRDVRHRIALALKPYSINIEDLLIDNITFSPAFTRAIEDKQIATQQAQAAQNRVATARYHAQQIIQTAEGQAKANILKRQTLTPLLVEQNAIDKLNPNVQVIYLPASNSALLNALTGATPTGTSPRSGR